MHNKEARVNINEGRLEIVSKLITQTVDRVISGEVEGVLTKPKTVKELDIFNDTIKDIILTKITKRLGV